MKVTPEQLPDMTTILELWEQAWREAPSTDIDPKVLKQMDKIRAYDDINQTFKKLLADYINQ